MTNLTRIKRVIIIVLILMTIFSFVAVINLHTRLEGYIEAQDILIEYNERTSGIRNKMRLHYAGKTLIQPMDVVHIYMSSKQTIDSKVSDGLQGQLAGLNLGQKISNLTRDINSMLGDLKGMFSD